jgi:dihydrofolate synthase/folylpolyglutamate synthase
MPALTYADLLQNLFPRLTGGIRWGLERTERLLAFAGDPHRSYRVIHVGGTNGKGSVAAQLDSVLGHAGHRTGLYTSPHLCTFRERIRIDGDAIGEQALLDAAAVLWPALEREAPSFFEATTAIAFLALARAGVDVAVVEVGLGGRLDATNVVQPDATVLTNVSLDHVQLLGPTVSDVAREKAGIIKRGVPVITSESGSSAAAIFEETAAAVAAPLHVVSGENVTDVRCTLTGTSFGTRGTPWGDLALTTPLLGPHQAVNAALAVHALGMLPEPLRPTLTDVRAGIARTRWPGRLQLEWIAGVPWLFDVAHNVAGVEALTTALHALPVPWPVTVVVGVLAARPGRHRAAHRAADGSAGPEMETSGGPDRGAIGTHRGRGGFHRRPRARSCTRDSRRRHRAGDRFLSHRRRRPRRIRTVHRRQ